MVPYGGVLADIGCDHAYLAIDLIKSGMVSSAICSDINRDPLRRGEENVREAGLSDRIKMKLSDGLSEYEPGEVSTVVISGMGGKLMINIIKNSPDIAKAAGAVILQPQSEIEALRHFLFAGGYQFLDEGICREGDKYYFSMKVRFAGLDAPDISRAQIIRERYGPLLWGRRDPLLREYVIREWERRAGLLADERIAGSRRTELEEELYTDGIALQHLNEG